MTFLPGETSLKTRWRCLLFVEGDEHTGVAVDGAAVSLGDIKTRQYFFKAKGP